MFYAAIYFKAGGQWYDLELNGVNKLPAETGTGGFGYSAPELYAANAYLRAVDIYPDGMVSAGPAWGMPEKERPTISIAQRQASVTVGSTGADISVLSLSNRLELWPVKPGTLAPPPNSNPTPDSIVVLSGSWKCL